MFVAASTETIFTDFFAIYEKPHFLQLDPKQPNKFVAAIPKIKFRFWRFPYWGGVVLVHDDGTIEDLSREEALADKIAALIAEPINGSSGGLPRFPIEQFVPRFHDYNVRHHGVGVFVQLIGP